MNSQLNSLTMRPALASAARKPSRPLRQGSPRPRSAALVANADGDLFATVSINGGQTVAGRFEGNAGIVSLLEASAPSGPAR